MEKKSINSEEKKKVRSSTSTTTTSAKKVKRTSEDETPKEEGAEPVTRTTLKEPLKITYSKTMELFLKDHFKNLRVLFKVKLGVLDNYDSITDSTEGYVELHSKERKKKLRIKLGRLFRKLITAHNTVFTEKPLELKDELIETIHNKWTSFNAGITHELVTGKDILKAYSNEAPSSCMTNAGDRLKLYTSNPDKVNSMIFYYNGKICGRTLVWRCDDGELYHDRIYFSNDWGQPYMQEILKRNGIKSAKTSKLTVTLEKIDFPSYPYMDTFVRRDNKKKQLANF